MIHYLVSSPQLGFVPGRIITESSHLAKLIQAYLDEKDEDGLLVALDWEKAFDSISWDYLHEAVRALGFGPDIRRWYAILYNSYDPPERSIQANGQRSTPFHLYSGIPQGCPLSPLTFIFVSEALTRLVQSSPNYKGIMIKLDLAVPSIETAYELERLPTVVRDDGRAPHLSPVLVTIEASGAMQRASVVPDGHVTSRPLPLDHEALARCVR